MQIKYQIKHIDYCIPFIYGTVAYDIYKSKKDKQNIQSIMTKLNRMDKNLNFLEKLVEMS